MKLAEQVDKVLTTISRKDSCGSEIKVDGKAGGEYKSKVGLVFGIITAVSILFTACSKESQSKSLDGAFGIKFGKVMSADVSCSTNNVGALVYEYDPPHDPMFNGHTEFMLFATPLTRQVFQVRAIINVDDDIELEMDRILESLQMEFNRKALSLSRNSKAIVFQNHDGITIEKKRGDDNNLIFIDACSARFTAFLKYEKIKQCAKDIDALALLPKKKDGEKIQEIDSVLGIKFGTQIKNYTSEEKDSAQDTWIYHFEPNRTFMGCEDYRAFATMKTKAVFMVRVSYTGDEYEIRYEQIRDIIESITGRRMHGKDKDLSMRFGDCLITLEENKFRGTVILDFVRVSLYTSRKEERQEMASPDSAEAHEPDFVEIDGVHIRRLGGKNFKKTSVLGNRTYIATLIPRGGGFAANVNIVIESTGDKVLSIEDYLSATKSRYDTLGYRYNVIQQSLQTATLSVYSGALQMYQRILRDSDRKRFIVVTGSYKDEGDVKEIKLCVDSAKLNVPKIR